MSRKNDQANGNGHTATDQIDQIADRRPRPYAPFSMTLKLIDPLNQTQHRLTINGGSLDEVFTNMQTAKQQAVELGYEIDHYPFIVNGEANYDHVEQPATEISNLAGLADAAGNPLPQLPPGAQPPPADKRPCRWCEVHQVWMWQRKSADGKRRWFSHPAGDTWCKGAVATAQVA